MSDDRLAQARVEAERLADRSSWTYTSQKAARMHGFVQGVEWADAHPQETSTLPERFREPDDLARFVIENEWALDSEINPSGRADWHETLHRVHDAWDADTPEDIVSTIAAAIRLDRSFRAERIEVRDE